MNSKTSSRRKFLQQSAAISLGFFGLQSFLWKSCEGAAATEFVQSINMPYGPLLDDPHGMINLPEGFSYRVISKVGEVMSDGFFTPGLPDGMATFAGPAGKTIIIRNHELISTDPGAYGANNELIKLIPADKMYDIGSQRVRCKGGTTTLIYNESTGELESSWLSLAGTIRNCAGGKTPWNSWITCEETFVGKSKNLKQRHGYNFEVPVTHQPQMAAPIPLKAMGRFNHEAVCVDPATGIVYQTEDRNDSLIYRFLPHQKQVLQAGGKLQVLVIKAQKSMDTRNWKNTDMPINKSMEVEWLDLDDVNPSVDNLRYRGHNAGAARFARGEGMWFGNGEVYFACTSGGQKKWGQVFRYVPSPYEGTPREKEQPGTLELFLEPNDKALL
ncbi:MAG: alkaline phosphatase PhoX, partial [Bacteroidota bacterium]